jgi:SAM-dependent methyltransferase
MKSLFSEKIQSCRMCGNREIEVILDLGAQPLANSLRQTKEEALPVVPLVLCRCQNCSTVQLTETVSPDYLFSNYVWVTGTSKGAQDYSRVFCERLTSRSKQGRLFIIEVASNDGTFLKTFQRRGDKVLGIDPARNIAAVASEAGIPTIPEFFGLALANKIVADHGNADIVFARNVISHVANGNDVVAGMAHCLKGDGTGAIEFHRADVILEELHYDSIYHEHLFYHSLHSICILLDQFGLQLFDVTDSPISGGSLVAYFAKVPLPPTDSLKQMLEHEAAAGIGKSSSWREFALRCEQHRRALRALVEQTKAAGKRLIGYGASARSSTLLNYCGIDHRHLELVADKNTMKHGRYTPGTDIPIVAPERAFAKRPDSVLLLAWNFRKEILRQIRDDYGWQGEIIVPLPGDPVVIQI